MFCAFVTERSLSIHTIAFNTKTPLQIPLFKAMQCDAVANLRSPDAEHLVTWTRRLPTVALYVSDEFHETLGHRVGPT